MLEKVWNWMMHIPTVPESTVLVVVIAAIAIMVLMAPKKGE